MRLLFILFILSAPSAFSCTRWWVGSGSANTWAATANTNWATSSGGANNAAVPGSTDDVCFDGNSGSGNSVIGAGISIKSLDCTGYIGTITHNSAVTLTVANSFTLVAGMTYTLGNTNSSGITFNGTTAGQTITTAGKSVGSLNFNGTGGVWAFQDAVTFAANASITMTKGTLQTNGKTVTGGMIGSSGTSTRALDLGASSINLSTSGTFWSFATSSGITLTAGTSTITSTYVLTNATTFAGGGLTYNNVTINGGSTGIATFTGANTFNALTFGHPKAVVFPGSATTTVTTLSAVGTSGNVITFTASAGSATISQASGTICSDWVNLTNIVGTGGASFFAGANSTNGGGNTGWTFTACPSGPAVMPSVL